MCPWCLLMIENTVARQAVSLDSCEVGVKDLAMCSGLFPSRYLRSRCARRRPPKDQVRAGAMRSFEALILSVPPCGIACVALITRFWITWLDLGLVDIRDQRSAAKSKLTFHARSRARRSWPRGSPRKMHRGTDGVAALREGEQLQGEIGGALGRAHRFVHHARLLRMAPSRAGGASGCSGSPSGCC